MKVILINRNNGPITDHTQRTLSHINTESRTVDLAVKARGLSCVCYGAGLGGQKLEKIRVLMKMCVCVCVYEMCACERELEGGCFLGALTRLMVLSFGLTHTYSHCQSQASMVRGMED